MTIEVKCSFGMGSSPDGMRQHMDHRQLRAFLAITDTGSVTRAADLLNLVQPAVSRQLRALEEDLGTTLFERSTHGMVLTDAGRMLEGHARRSMLELERARAEIGGTTTRPHGLVTVGLLPSTAALLSGPLVSAVAQAYPGIRIRIASSYAGTLTRWLETGDVDLALLYGAPRGPGIVARPLIDEGLWIVGPPSARFRRQRPVRLQALQDARMVLPGAPHGIRTLVDHACASAGVRYTLAAETDALAVQRSLVLSGLGLTVLPAVALAEDLAAGLVSAAPLGVPPMRRTIELATSGARVGSAAIRAVADLTARCAQACVGAKHWLDGRWLGAAD